MKDVQSQTDMRRIPLKHVGIKKSALARYFKG